VDAEVDAMILVEAGLGALLQKVFIVYGVFWITVLVVLFFAVGALLARYDQSGKGH
jgi:hypothetical protein